MKSLCAQISQTVDTNNKLRERLNSLVERHAIDDGVGSFRNWKADCSSMRQHKRVFSMY